ncbi:hypothetical protein [Vibrio phage vB_VpaP_M9]|nr:hypothetical protein [Vibrio phage vB_VpaP_M9]
MGKPSDCVGGAAVLCACLFCSPVNSLACHLLAYGYLLAIHLLTYGIYDALCYWLAIHLLSSVSLLLSLCYPIDLRLSLSLRFAPALQ